MDNGAQLLEIALPVPLPRTFSYRYVPAAEAPPAVVGDLVVAPFGRRAEVIGLAVACDPLPTGLTEVDGATLRDVARVLPEAYRLDAERIRLARWLAEYYALPLGEIVPLFHPPAPGTRRQVRRREAQPPEYPRLDPGSIVLTEAQRVPAAAAESLLRQRKYGALLLHGVTGSGKTEVYLAAIAAALAQGRGAIYLLPEIALTPQTLARITHRFGDEAATIHSGLSAGERCRVHEGAAAGRIRVVVGPRSALFAPVRDLGVIVVDEEHDGSYKQDEKPRYHARHTALVRGRENRAVVILGSATPDLESLVAVERGLIERHVLPQRMGADRLPEVRIVDMRGTLALDGFTNELLDAVAATLEQGRQALIYYNRRGFARILQCGDCGEVLHCRSCDIGMTLHLRPRRLLCHYCGFAQSVPAACPACGSPSFLPAGGGTEKAELNLQGQFPQARILRLDHDTTRRRGSHQRILAAFARGEADILIGTQMVAKGHHFPGVDVVGVLAADEGLGMPDYRAAERTFQLLTQVAGRAGRNEPGRVIFQTWRPEDPVIQAAAGHDLEAFLTQELPVRRACGYPPFQRLVRLGLQGRRQGTTETAANELAAALRQGFQADKITVLGPAPGVFPRLHDRYRFQILLKGNLTAHRKGWLSACARSLRETYRDVDVFHDVDPLAVY